VSAPAGFGKTTLLAEWFGERDGEDRSTAWLSLDARDNDPAVFWSYVVAALQAVAPAVGETAMSLLHSSQSLESVVAALLNDLGELTSDVVLVLDDYHVIESAATRSSDTGRQAAVWSMLRWRSVGSLSQRLAGCCETTRMAPHGWCR
jgi:ATP/maltotriose-dependent transcriptional regulator MalT